MYSCAFRYARVVEVDSLENLIGKFELNLYSAKPRYYYEQCSSSINNNRTVSAALLKNVIVYGSSNVVSVDKDRIIYELYYYDRRKKFNYSDTAIVSCHDDCFVIQYKKCNRDIENGVLFSGNYSWNYYHFVYEILAKFYLMGQLHIPDDVPLLIDEVVSTTPQFEELLNFFNSSKRKIVYLKSGCSYSVNELYFLPLINFIPPNYNDIRSIEYADCQFALQGLDFLRNSLLQKRASVPTYKRIYLSRKHASKRRRFNENEVVAVFAKYDFHILNPLDYTVAEQISLFNNADFIAGVTGAAFTNILFCREKCKILCIQSTDNELSIFSSIADYLALDMQYYVSDKARNNTHDIHDKFAIDTIDLEHTLVNFLGR